MADGLRPFLPQKRRSTMTLTMPQVGLPLPGGRVSGPPETPWAAGAAPSSVGGVAVLRDG